MPLGYGCGEVCHKAMPFGGVCHQAMPMALSPGYAYLPVHDIRITNPYDVHSVYTYSTIQQASCITLAMLPTLLYILS